MKWFVVDGLSALSENAPRAAFMEISPGKSLVSYRECRGGEEPSGSISWGRGTFDRTT